MGEPVGVNGEVMVAPVFCKVCVIVTWVTVTGVTFNHAELFSARRGRYRTLFG